MSMTREQAEAFLGLSSLTMTNMLDGGHFPSFYATGVFAEDEVMDFHRFCENIRERNRTGDLSPPDCDDDFDPPLL